MTLSLVVQYFPNVKKISNGLAAVIQIGGDLQSLQLILLKQKKNDLHLKHYKTELIS